MDMLYSFSIAGSSGCTEGLWDVKIVENQQMKFRAGLMGAASTLVLMACSGTVLAADLPMKSVRPMAASIPVASWQGAYFGAHVGGGHYDTNMAFWTEAGVCGDTSGSHCADTATGFLGGVQFGYNWQSGVYVYGVEADWAWTDFDHRTTDSSGFFTKAEMDWIATFRGRMGLAVDNTMAYVTGGLALADIKSGWGGPNYSADDGSRVRAGWVAGVGVEHKFDPRWSVKGEVLYHDFGQENRSHFEPYNDGTYTTRYDHTVVTAKIGLNYKLPW